MLTHSIVYKVFQLLFSHSVVSDSFWPHGLQHARLPCPSPAPRACSNSCPLSWWCHPLSHLLLPASPPVFNLSQHQGLFQWFGSLYQVAKILKVQLRYQSYQWIFKVGFLKDRLVGSPCSPGDSQESSPAPQFESISLSFSLLYFHCVLKVVGPTRWAFHYNLAQLPTYAHFAWGFPPVTRACSAWDTWPSGVLKVPGKTLKQWMTSWGIHIPMPHISAGTLWPLSHQQD